MVTTLGLPHAPKRIEVYDNSHIQGTNAVGAMIVAGPDGFMCHRAVLAVALHNRIVCLR